MARRSIVLFTAFTLVVLSGCQDKSNPKKTEPLAIRVSKPVSRKVTNYVDFTGRANAIGSVNIIPRVTGHLIEMNFKEGDEVGEGEVLYEIDPRLYKAQLDVAEAKVSQSKANLDLAKVTKKRFDKLAVDQPGAVSQQDLDKYKALEEEAIANKTLAEGTRESAKLMLEWTKVRSPIRGIASRHYLSRGNLVNADQTLLTTIMSMDPMFVYFDMDEQTLLQIKRAVNEGKIISSKARAEPMIYASTLALLGSPLGHGQLVAIAALYPGRPTPGSPVMMGLAGDEGFPHQGTFNFIDNQVNPGTGSISARGIFKNPKPGPTYVLVPGMFVRVRMQLGQPQRSLLVNDKSVISEQGKKLVYVVDAQNKVQKREVQMGQLQEDGFRVIENGLTSEDWVLVGGLQQVQPGMTIRPDRSRPWEDVPKK